MNIHAVESQIIDAYNRSDRPALEKIQRDLAASILKMDRWFDKYLDLFSDKIGTVDKADPVKRLYNSKCKEYSEITHLTRVVQNYMVK